MLWECGSRRHLGAVCTSCCCREDRGWRPTARQRLKLSEHMQLLWPLNTAHTDTDEWASYIRLLGL